MSNEDPDEGKGFCWERICTCKNKLSEFKKIFTINGIIDQYYKETLSGMIGNERELRKELVQLRSKYNCWSGFISKFISSLLITVVLYIFSVVKDNQLLSFVVLVVLFIALFKALSLKAANEEYEKMELIKDELEKIRYEEARYERMKALEAEFNEMKLIRSELEKINNTIQPNPKKTSIRIYNRSSVRRSIFGR